MLRQSGRLSYEGAGRPARAREGRLIFHYGLVDSDETREIYAKWLAEWLERFRKSWDARPRPTADAAAVERAFRSWWIVKGPTSFATVADSSRFRRELLAAATASISGVA